MKIKKKSELKVVFLIWIMKRTPIINFLSCQREMAWSEEYLPGLIQKGFLESIKENNCFFN